MGKCGAATGKSTPIVYRWEERRDVAIPTFHAHFTPCVEVGWRLASAYWGHGYATDGGRAAIVFGFECLKLPEVVSFTVPDNHRSRRVMERLGMVHSPTDDFDHPHASSNRRKTP